ncbi:hypothetical protein B0H34DRAFT_120992 [Crassisporium funariophilum]|nr:hypothetical protein B0H34DRAFT_120992 [Crassisporium funariophilum]
MKSLAPIRYPSPTLPLEVLRRLFESAARVDKRTASNLATLNRTIQLWIEEIIYAQVILRHNRMARAFLSAMKSKCKQHAFFGAYVRSLVLPQDIDGPSVLEILSVCRGVVDLSYWATPNSETGHKVRGSHIITYPHPSSFHTDFGLAVCSLAPRKLSVLLHEEHVSPFKPQFNDPFFSSVTHLSIVNKWEDWTSWKGISSETMPNLTHIKFDLNVGNRHNPDDRSNACMKSTTGATSCPGGTVTSPWLDKLSKVANALSDILNHRPSLQVCVLLLRFDSEPAQTARFLSRLAGPNFPGCIHVGFDPRLVFVWEKESFRYNYAHSVQESMVWRSAETVIKAQRQLSGTDSLSF